MVGHFDDFELSFDKKRILTRKGKKYMVAPISMVKGGALAKLAQGGGDGKAKGKGKGKVHTLDLSAMKVQIDRKAEWRQIYFECWRQMRDFFYDPDLHGVDWPAMGDRYAELLPYVNRRDELTYIIGELIGELNCGHAYVGGGDRDKADRIKMGLLGARLSRSQRDGYYRIDSILHGANWNPELRSPLTEVDVEAEVGEYILAINGEPTNEMDNIYEALIGKAGQQVELTLNDRPDMRSARKVLVEPIDDEGPLYYYNWVQQNIRKVSEATNGEVGYIHVPNMVTQGLNEFVKHFYPQLNKKALIIDDRGNGGGNVSPMLIERLRRELDMVTISRNTRPSTSPAEMMIGPKVLLIDQYSASDGDLFPYRFKYHKIGTIIGQRSWGGTVGIRGSLPFVDGGTLSKPEFSRYDVAGQKWIIEGYGVDPDIEVVNDPAEEFEGRDAQLDKAIEVILEQMKNQPTELPEPPPYPRR